MARYIDADKLIEHLKDEIKACEPVFDGRANGKSVAYGTELGLKSAISFAETLATADVAPKSEVENYKKIAEQQQTVAMDRYFEIKRLKEELEKAKQAVAREIFEEIERIGGVNNGLFLYNFEIAELKKKYTEGREWTETNI